MQYEETKRLSLMPLLQLYEAEATDSANNKGFRLSFGSGESYRYSSKCISLRNIGLGSAKNIVFDCYNDNNGWKIEHHPLKTIALISGNHVNIILSSVGLLTRIGVLVVILKMCFVNSTILPPTTS